MELEESVGKLEKRIKKLEGTIKKIREIVSEYLILRDSRNTIKREISSLESELWEEGRDKEKSDEKLESKRYDLEEIRGKLEGLEGRIEDFDDLEALEFYLREKKPEIIQKVSRMQVKLNQFKEEVKKW